MSHLIVSHLLIYLTTYLVILLKAMVDLIFLQNFEDITLISSLMKFMIINLVITLLKVVYFFSSCFRVLFLTFVFGSEVFLCVDFL